MDEVVFIILIFIT